MIAVVNYEMGNVHSVVKALQFVAPNETIVLTKNQQQLLDADKIVFPGQGAMGPCIKDLQKNKLIDTLKQCINNKPFLGICLGLQLLFEKSQEDKKTRGLKVFEGEVIQLTGNNIKIPHMGWNEVKQTIKHPLWHNIKNNSHFYHANSYIVKPKNNAIIAGTTHYGQSFPAAVYHNQLFAVQFHPEKSQKNGLTLLKNFINWQ